MALTSNCPDADENAAGTWLLGCCVRECAGSILVFPRQHHRCSTSVLSHLATADFALHSRRPLWGGRHRRSLETGWKMVALVVGVFRSVKAWFRQLSCSNIFPGELDREPPQIVRV